MTTWHKDLSHYQHTCGQPILVGESFNGYQLRPTFQTEPGHIVYDCPQCGRRLNLNHCRHTPPEASTV